MATGYLFTTHRMITWVTNATIIALLMTQGCSVGKTGNPKQPSSAMQSRQTAQTSYTLIVLVKPRTGISIYLDDIWLSNRAPVRTRVALGPHQLRVRGMGYHEVVVPFQAQAGSNPLQIDLVLQNRGLQNSLSKGN